MRYFFKTSDPEGVWENEEPYEFRDLATAEREARAAILEIGADDANRLVGRNVSLDILDERRSLLVTFNLSLSVSYP